MIGLAVEAQDFEATYHQYIYLIRYLAARYCSPTSPDFEDYMQEGLVALWQALQNFDQARGNELSFVCGCVRKKLINRLDWERRKRWRQEISLESGEVERLLACLNNPEDTVIAREELREKTSMLTKKELLCFLMFGAGFSYAEIAEALCLPLKSVDNALYRAKIKFRCGVTSWSKQEKG